jgi:hypothetical protein
MSSSSDFHSILSSKIIFGLIFLRTNTKFDSILSTKLFLSLKVDFWLNLELKNRFWTYNDELLTINFVIKFELETYF